MKRRSIGFLTVSILVVGGALFGNAVSTRNRIGYVETLERRVTLADLASESDLILIGKIGTKSTRVIQTEVGNMPYEDWQIQPIETWKGTAPQELQASLLVEAGNGTLAEGLDSGASLQKGKTMLLFFDYLAEDSLWSLSARQAVFYPTSVGYKNASNDVYTQSSIRAEIARIAETTPSLAELAGVSDVIVFGSLTKGDSFVGNVNGAATPYTRWTITPQTTYKSTVTDALFEVSWIGGDAAPGTWIPYEIPIDAKDGTQALFFLRKGEDVALQLVSADHGVFLRQGGQYVDMRGVGYSEAEMLAAVGSK